MSLKVLAVYILIISLLIGCKQVDKMDVKKDQPKAVALSVEDTVKKYINAVTKSDYKEAWKYLSKDQKDEYTFDGYWSRYGHRSNSYTTSYTIKHIDYFDDHGKPTAYVYIKFDNHLGDSSLSLWKESGFWKIYYTRL